MEQNTDPVRALIADWREEAAECHAESETPAVKRDPRAYAGFASASRILTRCADEAESALASAPPSAPVGDVGGVMRRALCRIALGHEPAQVIADEAIAEARKAALSQQPAAPSGEAVAWPHYTGSVLTSGADNEARVTFAFSSRDEAERFHGVAIAMLYAAPQQPAAVDEAWRQKAADWLESKAAEQEANNEKWPDHAAAYKEWRDRPGILRSLAIQVLAAQQQGGTP